MNGQFIVVADGFHPVGGTFADDVSANEYARDLREAGLFDTCEVLALCPVCAMHVELADGVCTAGNLPEPTSYDTNIATLGRVLAGLRAL